MKGAGVGEDRYNIPMYEEPVNNPMIPTEQKKIYQESKPIAQDKIRDKSQDKTQTQYPNPPYPNPQNANQVLNLQLYQPKPPAKPQVRPNPAVFYPNYVPNPFDPVSYGYYMQQTQYNPQPLFKEYTINIGGVAGSHVGVSMIYEDALPIKNIANTFNSLGERLMLYEYIRSIMFSKGDGTNMAIEAGPTDTINPMGPSSAHNLLSHVKFMDMNPYNASKFSNNPYRGLAYGFLLYRSCYPIRHDAKSASAICSNNSTGINVRIYRLTEGAYMANRNQNNQTTDYDEWRDIAFYNYVKEHIIKSKVSPNFTIMYGYNITLNSGIDFDGLYNKNNPVATQIQNTNTGQTINLQNNVTIMTNQPNQSNPQLNNIIELNKYKGKAIVCLTEASNYSLLGWAKKQYKTTGNIKQMINPGYHTRAVWESIIFQLLAALYVMQIKGIIINDFALDRNVFIKDISINGTVTNYWKYKISGIEYYIPNHGYLLLIDTNYRDFDKLSTKKINGKFIDNTLEPDNINSAVFEIFRKVFDTNTFGQTFVDDNGIKPPEEVLRLIGDIRNEADSKPTYNISYYIRKYMTHFLNNRVGTLLSETEVPNIKIGGIKEFRKGQIVVTVDENGINRFVIHVSSDENGVARIITKDNMDPKLSNIIEKEVPVSSLNEYSIVENVKQNYNINEANLNDESLLETYNLD